VSEIEVSLEKEFGCVKTEIRDSDRNRKELGSPISVRCLYISNGVFLANV
jgi:hypothetical protein